MPRTTIIKPKKLPFIPSGSTLLDLVLGGGWAEGRVANIVGDKSSGKTLLAIEACANFARLHSPDQVAYREIEAAFDQNYAQSIGMPRGIDYSEDVHTIEDFERDLMAWLAKQKGPNLYLLDSLDAASSEAEMERETGEASYGQEKAKALSQMFRKIAKEIKAKQCTLFIISQIRDNIGARFGETKKRSGGHALDFYSSQVIWLAEIAKIKRTVSKVDRVTGVKVLINNKKNKIGIPFRRAGITITFGYGVDDEISMIDWLKENKGEELLPRGLAEYPKLISAARDARDRSSADGLHLELKSAVCARWEEIEAALRPPMSKYGN